MDAFLSTAITLNLLVVLRLNIAHKHSMRAIGDIYKRPDYKKLAAEHLTKKAYFYRIFTLTKWTYKQMFPEL
jgi:hypothetical protein